ncbi:MAG: helix-turn-helix transcriptional regulator [Alphaproteobacteria bacterium]|nr:helix-turn-helix transcriptional regulator [Alphaproteobacteria bacterium]
MSVDLNKIVGENIRTLRESMGLNSEEFAKLITIPELRLTQIEAGNIRATADELYDIKTALKVEVKELYHT